MGDLIEALQVFREDRRRNLQLSEGPGYAIIVSVDRYRNQLLLSGREDLIKEVFLKRVYQGVGIRFNIAPRPGVC